MFKAKSKNVFTLSMLKDYIGCIMLSLMVLMGYEYENNVVALKLLNSFNFDVMIATLTLSIQWYNLLNRGKLDAYTVSCYNRLNSFMGISHDYCDYAHFFINLTRGAKCY